MTLLIKGGNTIGCLQDSKMIFCEQCCLEKCPNKQTAVPENLTKICVKHQNESKQPLFTPIGNIYEHTALEIAQIVSEKQKQYGNSFGKAGEYLRLLYPNGIQPEQYNEMLALVRDFDKSMRIANGNQGNEDAWSDKLGYALLAVVRNRQATKSYK